MAISQDGYIADQHNETPWSDAEWESFKQFVSTCDVVVIGRRTFEIMRANDEFIDGPRYLVATSGKQVDTGTLEKIQIRKKEDLPKVEKLGIIGGGDLNGRLAKLGLIDEIILDIEPIELGNGIRLFGSHDVPLRLTLLNSRLIGKATIQRHYKVLS